MEPRRKRILVVEDDDGIREALEFYLSETYDITPAANGVQALDLLAEQHFDVVLLDMAMPVLDGAGVLTELAARGDDVPVLVASAGQHVQTATRLGARGCISKPFNLAILDKKLVELSSGPTERADGSGSNIALLAPRSESPARLAG